MSGRRRRRSAEMMEIPLWIEKAFHLATDGWFAVWPQPVPERERLRRCKIVSHRGEHDNRSIFENTLAAFERVCRAGVWGIEFDVRWTKDLQPVVVHDADLRRVFQMDLKVGRLTWQELHARCPLVPTLAEVISTFGGRVHLMIEIKAECYPQPVLQSRILEQHFKHLIPQTDYHFLTLVPAMLAYVEWCPRSACLPIAQLNLKSISNLALKGNYGGINGHYLFLTRTILNKHLRKNQQIGTGFVGSRNSLFRELNRGVEWIFTNHALKLLGIRAAYLA